MRTTRTMTALLAAAVLAVACGGGGGGGGTGDEGPPAATSPTPSPECSASGTELQIAAKGVKFDEECLAAPADTEFTIEFANNDAGIPHNVVIENGDKLFEGEIFEGVETRTYQVPAIPAGTYKFYCEVHPNMNGVFVSQ